MLASTMAAQPAQASYGQQVRNMTVEAGGVTAAQMAQAIMPGTTVSNASFSGDQRQGGTVSGFDGIGFPNATILATGLVSMVRGEGYNSQPNCGYCPWLTGSAVAGPNWQKDTTFQFGTAGDSDVDALIKYMSPYYHPTKDAATLQFDFLATSGTVQIPYIFASERYQANWRDTGWIYPDPMYASFYSAMGIWVNNVNCAVVGPRNEVVSINTVNHLRNTDYYRGNPVVDKYGESRYPTGFNGMTTVLTCQAAVTSGQMNHVKITVADVDYSNYDSAVFVGTGSFVPDKPGMQSTLTVDKNSTPVNTNITATATIKDDKGNPLPGMTVSFSKTNADVSLQAPTCTTSATGTCQITVTSAKPVSDQLWATVMSGGAAMQLTGSPQPVAFTSVGPDPDKSRLSLDKPSAPVNTNIRATTSVVNAAGDPMPGVMVTYSVKSAAVNLSAPMCVTEPNGTCYVEVTSARAGMYTDEVAAKVMVNGALVHVQNSPATVAFTIGAPDNNTSTLELDKTSTPVGTNITATTTVRDSNNNPLPGITVSYTNESPEVHLQMPSCDTDATGKCSITVTSTVAKTYPNELHAKVAVNGVLVDVKNSPATVTFTPGGVSSSRLDLDKPSTPVGTNITATTTVVDAGGNPVGGITVSYTKKSAAITLDKPSCSTGPDGKCSVTVTSNTAGLYTGEVAASVTVGGQPVQVQGSPATVEFTPKGPNRSGFVVTPVPDPFDRASWVLANGTEAYTGVISLVDDAGNPVTNANLADIQIDKTNPALTITTPVNNGDGTYTVKITSTTEMFDGWVRLRYKGTVVGSSYTCLFKS